MDTNARPQSIHSHQRLDKSVESDNVCGVKLADSEYSARVSCAGCGRSFLPTGPQRYCSHDCYSGALRVPIEQRFWSKVNKTCDCWLWTAATIRGYGQIASVVDGKRRPVYAHRVAWELTYGPIPAGLEVLHRCDVPLCVRPDHLFLGTQQDNLADARQKGRLDERRGRTRILSPWDRLAIYNTPSHRRVCAALARRYGVGASHIASIRRGRFARPSAACSFDLSRQSFNGASQCDQAVEAVRARHGRHSAAVVTSVGSPKNRQEMA